MDIRLRTPHVSDGAAVFRLVQDCPPLDPNSMYCNLLQCSHFAQSSVAAECDGELVGFISGYLLPDAPDTLFVWQVAVAPSARGQGLALRMLEHLLERELCIAVRYLETTITESNSASWALFTALARSRGASLQRSMMFDRDAHFAAQHDSELLARIGPFS